MMTDRMLQEAAWLAEAAQLVERAGDEITAAELGIRAMRLLRIARLFALADEFARRRAVCQRWRQGFAHPRRGETSGPLPCPVECGTTGPCVLDD